MDVYYDIEQYLEQNYDCVATIYDGDELEYTDKEGVIKVKGLSKTTLENIERDLQNQGYDVLFDKHSFRSNKPFEATEGVIIPKGYRI